MKKFILILWVLATHTASSSGQLANWTDASKTAFPVNISSQPAGSCRIAQMKFHSSDPDKYYAVTPQGGLFTSVDGGEHWTVAPGTDALTYSCASICIDRTDDRILYLGTGDPNIGLDGAGVLKSIDGGVTFTPTSLANKRVMEIIQHPTDPHTFIAATNKGIYKSTDDGGQWTLTSADSMSINDMKQNAASNSLILYASTTEFAARFFRSTDFGNTWTQITSGIVAPTTYFYGGSRIAVTPANPDVVYFSQIGGGGMLFKSTDSGLSFTMQKAQGSPYLVFYENTSTSNSQGNYNNALCVDALDPAKVWVQSQNTWYSSDSGVTWKMLTHWSSNVHTDHHHLVQSPYDANKLYSCNDGGIWLSTNGGVTWTPKSDGLYAFEIPANAGKSSHTDKDLVSIGTQDNGRLFSNGNGWYCHLGGDDYENRIFDYQPNGGYLYGLGHNTRTKFPNISTATYGIPTLTVEAMGFNRTNPELGFMASGNTVYRTTNLSAATPAWEPIAGINRDFVDIHSCIADPNKLYVLAADNRLYVSSNALSASPTFNSYPLPVTADGISSITAICNNANIVYLCSNHEVYRSQDGGQTWPENVTYNLPDINHRRILAEEYGGAEELVFIATNNAVYYKKAGDTSWTNYSTNLPARKSPTDFSMFDDGTNRSRIRYASYGRAIWETGFDNLRVAQAAFTADRTGNLCLSDGVVHFTDLSLGGATAWSWSFPGGTPSSSTDQNPSVVYNTPGTYSVSLTITTPSGDLTVTKPNYITATGSVAGAAYNVGPGGNFTSITGAVNYWNSTCIDGPVVFNLTGTTYNTASGEVFPITINSNNPGSSLLIKPVGNVSITGSSATSLIILNAVDRVTIDGSTGNTSNTICPPSAASRNLTISNTFNSTTSAVVWLQNNGTDGATDNTVKNCTVIGNSNIRTLIGIGSGSSTVSTSSFGIGNHRNSFINNSVQKTQYGIYSGGQSTINKNSGTVINQNALNSSGDNSILRTGILVKFEDNIQISGNTIANMNPVNNSGFTGAHGIALARESGTGLNDIYNLAGAEVSGASVTYNVIDNIQEGASMGNAIGIFVGAINSTTGSGVNLIANNFITRINAPFSANGFYAIGIACGNGNNSDTRIYNNTIHLTGTPSNNVRSFGLLLSTSFEDPVIQMKNNLISNQLTANSNNYAIRINAEGPFPRLFSDHNNFYTTGGFFGSTPFGDVSTFANWKTLTGTDANSKNILPEYISDTDPHLTSGGANNIAHIFGSGTALASVPDDIDCEDRHPTNPAIGADEKCAAPTVPTLSATLNNFCAGISTTLKVTSGTLNSATQWRWYTGACGATLAGTGNSIVVAPTVTTTYYVRGEGRCVTPGNCASITVTVNGPAVTITGPQSICSGENVTLVASGNASAYAWSHAGGSGQSATFSNLSQTTTFTVTVTGSVGCTATAVKTVVVNPQPTVTCPANSPVCLNTPAYALSDGLPSGGIYSGMGVQAGTFNPSAAGIGAHTVTYDYTDANGCANACSYTITVNAPPAVTCAGSSTICLDAPAMTLTGGSPSGGVYSGTGVQAGMFDPAAAGVGAHGITYDFTDANGCANACSYTITVNALPAVTCAGSSTVCLDAPAVTLTGSSPAGGVYSGMGVLAGMLDPSVAGVGAHTIAYDYTDANGCANACSYTITVNALPAVTCAGNSMVCLDAPAMTLTGSSPAGGMYSGAGVQAGLFDPSAAGVGAHAITYDYTDANGCSNACDYTITVNALPATTCPANTAVCLDASTISLSGGTPLGGVYSGVGVNAGSFDPSEAGIGAHDITYHYLDINGCANACHFAITVNALPIVTCATNTAVCLDASPISLTGGSPAGGVYSVSGETTGIFDPAEAGVGVHTVAYAYADANGCANDCSFTITVNGLPIVSCPGNGSVNINDPAFPLFGGSPAGGTFNGPGVNLGIFDPAAAGLGMHTITYQYTDANDCTNVCSYTLTVNNLPTVNCAGDSAVCLDTPAFVLMEGSPAGGVYSGPGVNAGMFDPVLAGVGVHTLTYTNGGSCSFSITVNALPMVTCPANSSVSLNSPAFALTGAVPSGGTYSGSGVFAGVFDPALAGAGLQTILYAFTDANDCANSCTYLITVDSTSSIQDLSNRKLSIRVSPNPTSGLTSIHFSLPESVETQLTVINALGEIVLYRHMDSLEGDNHVEIDLQALAAGVYQVRLLAGRMCGVISVGKL